MPYSGLSFQGAFIVPSQYLHLSADSRTFIGTVLPALVFPTVSALALKYLVKGSLTPNVRKALAVRAKGELSLAYTGVRAVDTALAGLVSFFQAGLEEEARPCTLALISSLAVVPAFAALEAGRVGRSVLLSPLGTVVFGYAYQKYTGALILPLYWLAFITTGQATRIGALDAGYAEATIFGTLVGVLIPSAIMVKTKGPQITAYWQAFPLWLYIGQKAYLLARPGSGIASGRTTSQALYALTFVVSAIPHLKLMLKHGPQAFARKLLTPRTIHPKEEITASRGVLNVLQWDYVFITASAWLGTFWMARNVKELAAIAAWDAVASAVAGPGAALSGVFAWRETWVTPLS
jgi:hypothetical protein